MTDQLAAAVDEFRRNPKGVRFSALKKVCEHYFGKCRASGSHHVFRMPWPGDPRVNIQDDGSGKAKAYQVKQVLKAIDFFTEKKAVDASARSKKGK